MTPAEARELVAQALESGEYEQGRMTLCRHNKYCCLGVATEIFMKHNPGVIEKIDEGCSVVTYRHGEESTSACLLNPVWKWLGFNSRQGFLEPSGGYTRKTLADLNDKGTPFKEIAKIFRNPPEGLLG